MPRLTRWFVKAALMYVVVALRTGVTVALRPVLNLPPAMAALQPVYFHLLMVGWVSQLIFGVVYWMFPKLSLNAPRGSERLGWATFWLLNAGLLLRALGEPWNAIEPGLVPGVVLAASAILQLAAGWAFAMNTWWRVKER